MASKIKKGDNVFILTGKDKGKTGKVLKVIKNSTIQDKVIVEGVNIVKKQNSSANLKYLLFIIITYQSVLFSLSTITSSTTIMHVCSWGLLFGCSRGFGSGSYRNGTISQKSISQCEQLSMSALL